MDPADFRSKGASFPYEKVVEGEKGKSSSSKRHASVESETFASHNKLSRELIPAGTHTPVDKDSMAKLKERVRSGSSELALTGTLVPRTASPEKMIAGPERNPFLEPPIQRKGLRPDLSSLRFFRDNPQKYSPAKMATFCLALEEEAFAHSGRFNLRKIGDFFVEVMAALPEFRKNLCTCKVLLTDINNPAEKPEEVMTNATTLLNDNKSLMNMVEDIGEENPAKMVLALTEDPAYAIPAIRFLETGEEAGLKDLDVYELAFLASKWESTRLQTYCKNHLEGALKDINEQFMDRLIHLCRLNDRGLNFIFLPMAAKGVECFTEEKWISKWDALTMEFKLRLIEAHDVYLRPLQGVSFTKGHPDRVRYSFELIEYVNARIAKTCPQDNFYVTASDVHQALRVLFHAVLYKDEILDPKKVYNVVRQFLDKLPRAKKEFKVHKSEPEIEKLLQGWCSILCNQLKPKLPELLLEHQGWHGEALSYAIDETSSEQVDVLSKCDEFVLTALKTAANYPDAKRVVWLMRPTTRFVSEGIVTVCAYDTLTEKYERRRIQYFDGFYYIVHNLSDRIDHFERVGEGHHLFQNLAIGLIRGAFTGIRTNEIMLVEKPKSRKEREKIYEYIKF